MKNQWSQFPFVLRRKILLTFLAGIASIAVSFVIFTVTADRILLVLGGLIFAASLVLGSSLWRTAARGRYDYQRKYLSLIHYILLYQWKGSAPASAPLCCVVTARSN